MQLLAAEKNVPAVWTGDAKAAPFTEFRTNHEIYLSVLCPELDVQRMLEWISTFQAKSITAQDIGAYQCHMSGYDLTA